MSESPMPIRLEKTSDRCLVIEWDDGLEQRIAFRTLRKGCQCATCIDKRVKELEEGASSQPKGVLPIISAAEAMPLNIEAMDPVGNYAYNIRFSDGHTTGIFTFPLLRSFESTAAN